MMKSRKSLLLAISLAALLLLIWPETRAPNESAISAPRAGQIETPALVSSGGPSLDSAIPSIQEASADRIPVDSPEEENRPRREAPKTVHIQGRVIDCNGAPVPDVLVRGSGNQSCRTQSDGSFEFDQPDSSRIFSPRVDPTSLGPEFVDPSNLNHIKPRGGDGWGFNSDYGVAMSYKYVPLENSSSTVSTGDIVLSRKSRIRGRATLPSGRPVQGNLSFKSESNLGLALRALEVHLNTGEYGEFKIENLPAGRYEARTTAWVSPPSGGLAGLFAPDPVEVEIGCGEQNDNFLVLFTKGMGTASASIHVEDLAGNPVSNVNFAVFKDTDKYSPGASCTSDEHGVARFEGLPEGTILISRTAGSWGNTGALILDSEANPEMRILAQEGESIGPLIWKVEVVQPTSVRGMIHDFPKNGHGMASFLEVSRPGIAQQTYSPEQFFDGEFYYNRVCPGKARMVFIDRESGQFVWEARFTILPEARPFLEFSWEGSTGAGD